MTLGRWTVVEFPQEYRPDGICSLHGAFTGKEFTVPKRPLKRGRFRLGGVIGITLSIIGLVLEHEIRAKLAQIATSSMSDSRLVSAPV